jgi:hypothetical protein
MTRTTGLHAGATALIAAVAIALAGPAAAEGGGLSGGSDGQAAQQKSAPPEFSQDKLDSFAAASIAIAAVVREYRPQLRQAQQDGDQQAFRRLQAEAKAAMDEKIAQTEGISVPEYERIAAAARQHDSLKRDVLERMRARQKGGQGTGGQGTGGQGGQ